jgi:chaperonin GroEL
MITTEAMVTELPQEASAAPMGGGMPDMGGMGGMPGMM